VVQAAYLVLQRKHGLAGIRIKNVLEEKDLVIPAAQQVAPVIDQVKHGAVVAGLVGNVK